jgi:hypothetical protein
MTSSPSPLLPWERGWGEVKNTEVTLRIREYFYLNYFF